VNKIRLAVFFLLLLSACSPGAEVSPLAKLTISKTYENITAEDQRTWTVTFEDRRASTFRGIVRHTSLWQDPSMPFMSHDILITTGDYASRGTVDTFVVNHKFIFHYKNGTPQGSINLLHIFPASDDVYQQLLSIQNWDEVSIHGREILRIDRFDDHQKNLGYFTDMGCNTILVTSVTIQAKGTPIP
jgi:hypothetical protein